MIIVENPMQFQVNFIKEDGVISSVIISNISEKGDQLL